MNIGSRLLRTFSSTKSTSSIEIDGKALTVRLRRNPQARQMILRLDKSGDGVNVTVPAFASFQAAMEFTAEHANWIKTQRGKRRPALPFAAGQAVPVRGRDHMIVHQPRMRGTVWLDHGPRQIHVAGRPEHLARRVKGFLKKLARSDLEMACRGYSEAMSLKFSRITIRDQSTRWGSCSAKGNLSFSWRLVLAPEFVLDYVAAHEVAHLQEMNHGKAFWQLVETHCPQTRAARAWLKANGADLHRYGG